MNGSGGAGAGARKQLRKHNDTEGFQGLTQLLLRSYHGLETLTVSDLSSTIYNVSTCF